jgi:methyl-accepting chemotaxis protein
MNRNVKMTENADDRAVALSAPKSRIPKPPSDAAKTPRGAVARRQAGNERGAALDTATVLPVSPRTAELEAVVSAISKTMAVIEFDMQGIVLSANATFLSLMNYRLEEIQGKHHSLFVDEVTKRSKDYREFWAKLNEGRHHQAEYKRLGKGAREVWIQASYIPVQDVNGKFYNVVKIATDVTQQKLMAADYAGQIAAIGKSQAVIEFDMDGTIRTANDHFLAAMGYRLGEIQGQHHSIFVDQVTKGSKEYRDFWLKLNNGQYQQAEYKRLGKNGREVWIQASYNPILDLNSRPFKVVKYATDVTEHVQAKIDLQQKVELILDVVRSATQGDLTKDIAVRGPDAIGQLGDGLGFFFTSLRHSMRHILQNAGSVGKSAQALKALSNSIAAEAANAAGQAEDASNTGREVIANGGDEMLASIRLIAGSSAESARVARQAVTAAGNAKHIVSDLGESSTKIGAVIKVITSIAEQTNLLALNATIEAARAGEAGRGFAVVAHEVKELAKATARATGEIGQKIDAIQHSTKNAVLAIGEIDSVIHQIDDISVSIACAIEEQTATTNHMGQSVKEASSGATEIANSIASVAKTAQNATLAANQTQNAANALASMASQLQTLLAQFKI